MVDLSTLAPGIKVKVVDEWTAGCGQNLNGLMDKYLGQIVTILEVDIEEDLVFIEEDSGDCRFHTDGHWTWNSYCFDYIVDDGMDFEPSSEEEIFSFIFK